MAKGLLGSTSIETTSSDAYTKVYEAPVATVVEFVTVNIHAVNRATTAAKVRIAICTTASPANKDFLEYDVQLEANGGAIERSCVLMGPGEKVMVSSNTAGVSVQVRGLEQLV